MHLLPERNKKILVKKIRYYKQLLFPGKGSGIRLADEVGVAPQMVSNWLSGKRLPTTMQLYRLSRVFDISPLELCGIHSKATQSKELDHIETIFHLLENCKTLFSQTDNIHIRKRKLKDVKSIIISMLEDYQ